MGNIQSVFGRTDAHQLVKSIQADWSESHSQTQSDAQTQSYLFHHVVWCKGSEEAWPARARVELGLGVKEGQAAHRTHVNTILLVVVRVAIRGFACEGALSGTLKHSRAQQEQSRRSTTDTSRGVNGQRREDGFSQETKREQNTHTR